MPPRPRDLPHFDIEGRDGDPSSTLRSYLTYRVLLAATLALLFFSDIGSHLLGDTHPSLFAWTITLYLGLAIFSWTIDWFGLLHEENGSYLAIFSDITVIVFLMHASGGVSSGLGMLIAVAIALASLSLVGRTALLFAAMATLAVVAETAYTHLSGSVLRSDYTQAGLLGIAFFALALLAHLLSARVRASEELAEQRGLDLANLEQLNEYVIQQMKTGVIVVDERDLTRLMNDAAWYLLGMPAGTRGRPLERASSALARQLWQWRRNEDEELPAFRPVSGGRDLKASFTPLGDAGEQGTLVFLEDTAQLTERAQQMKLASLGQLTASIAHEIRNPLGAISHAAQLLGESRHLAEEDHRMAEIIQGHSKRVNEVIENILSLSRRDNRQSAPLTLAYWLVDFARDQIQANALNEAQVKIEVQPENTQVLADPTQVTQILAAMFDNAVQHFDRPLSQLRIQILAGRTRDSGGPYIDFIDNGPGIPGNVVAQVFEPFFTTRRNGTGLGLYIARELSEANRIRMELVQLASPGTCFRLSFPDPRTLDRKP